MKNTYDRLTDILVNQFEVQPEEVRPDITFEELELDSLFLVELGLVIKRDLDVEIGEDDATPRSTVADVVKLIDAQLNPAS
ncbi:MULTISPECIES: acyl carrier protein [unclassified Streptomyces]|uniref:acyl carrier protein n=1 Tax=unclassified Streptomyces TaxID=2593676 RepID=UPI002254D7F9|nr:MULTISPECIES: phosphopantetheine-binding protein [unclassified Streptomyces]WSP53285.1 phosphopantetheine-binding protein [Streptomyces sp. NBC_01241]WSU26035.1 phosphopantetheine-binding protein [Streptomyces sp. NBC_01108]WTA40985.1 phosphopantetheine-binding protein [Streptomyces sp. NBC_00846]MCX4792034.1 phosphopantetheine-binding protein [Streptomyces sp. NBC_01221]MCX4799724.1 phosphopantetheine-binding protein [Streptomyces sp. NBC_01242]